MLMKTSPLFVLLLGSVVVSTLRAQTVFPFPTTPTVGQPIVGSGSGTPFVLVQPNAVQVTPVPSLFTTSQAGGVTIGAGQGNTGSVQSGTLPVSTVQTGFFPQGATPLVNLQLQFGTNPLIPVAPTNGVPVGVPSQYVGRGNFPPGTVFPGQGFTGSVGYAVAPSFVTARRRAMNSAEMQYAAQVAAADIAARRGHGRGGTAVQAPRGVGVRRRVSTFREISPSCRARSKTRRPLPPSGR